MPILSPSQVQNVLKKAGLEPPSRIEELLEENNLGKEDILGTLGDLMRCADDPIKMGIAKLGLQMHGLLKDEEVRQVPVVNIIINDAQHTGVNQILIPR